MVLFAAAKPVAASRLDLKVDLGPASGNSKLAKEYISVGRTGLSQGLLGLQVSFKRTLRVADNAGVCDLPPQFENFPIYKVADYVGKLPVDMANKGGVFLPMYQREAMWINFEATEPFLVKVSAGGINVISGESVNETASSLFRRASNVAQSKSIQDYVVAGQQPWIDGIVSEDGAVRQFVAVRLGTGSSLEAQMSGMELDNGIQFEIVPLKRGPLESFQVFVKALDGKTKALECESSATVEHLKNLIWDLDGTPVEAMRLVYAGKQLKNGMTLADYNIKKGATIHVVGSLKGGLASSTSTVFNSADELAIAPGGRIRQTIVRDTSKKEDWDYDRSIGFNVSILNSEIFTRVTGRAPPSTPITARSYADAGLPYFAIYNETPTGVYGDFGGLMSVNDYDKLAGSVDAEVAVSQVDRSTANPTVYYTWDDILNFRGRTKAPFRHLSELEESVRRIQNF